MASMALLAKFFMVHLRIRKLWLLPKTMFARFAIDWCTIGMPWLSWPKQYHGCQECHENGIVTKYGVHGNFNLYLWPHMPWSRHFFSGKGQFSCNHLHCIASMLISIMTYYFYLNVDPYFYYHLLPSSFAEFSSVMSLAYSHDGLVSQEPD